MAGSATRSFTSPAGAPAKMKGGKTHPKVKQVHGLGLAKLRDPLRHASASIPKNRKGHSNKSFHS